MELPAYFACVCLLITGINGTDPHTLRQCPNIVSRSKWNARRAQNIEYMVTPVEYAIIAHTVTSQCSSESACKESVKNLQNYFLDDLKYGDIGYSFLIGGDGKVYEGRGWHKVGAHTYHFNRKSIGIAFIGDFSDQLPSKQMLNAAKDLIECGKELEKLKSDYKLIGHRQVISSESPGLSLYEEIKNWPHWTLNP